MPRISQTISAAAVAALMLGLPTSLSAAECARTYFLDEYKAALAALKKNDRASAAGTFRVLAEQGFAPAQRRLGEELTRSGADERAEGLMWLRLAYDNSDQLALDAMKGSGASREELDTAKQAAAGWTARFPECMRGFESRLRAGDLVSLRDFIADVKLGKDNLRQPQESAKMLLALFFHLYRTDPTFLPYLRAINTIAIMPQSMSAMTVRLDGQSVLTLDEAMLNAPDPERLKTFLKVVAEAVRTQVHDQADPPIRLSVTHRGRTIVAFGHADAQQAVELIRKGIDLTETLPPDLRRLAGIVKEMRYEAPPMGEDVRSNGTYISDRGFIWFKRQPENISPRDVAASLVANGVLAEAARKGELIGPGTQRKANYEGQRAKDNL